MKKGIIIVCVVLMGMSVLGMVESSRLERTMKMGIGIGFLPFWMSAIIGALALALLVKVRRGKISHEDRPFLPQGSIPRVVSLAIALITYIILIEVIGYVPSTFLFFLTTIFILQRSRVMMIMFFGAVFTSLLYVIFKIWLKSPLPAGILGF